ncbi:YjgF-like protein [Punctularia strigosozonata HHB-11173 SS5]|uniref:YjgF-like protein n=1 Tax=Punctularia strigosozonata (strain HHB-11173) TaxID=741275 RepID=UPI0004416FCF|nr:YjgF-like protein [Punctularia strigosozonata HHB-11173 SS5]EIN14250.1 YjgF-like protein [Punctularia strigosozonata HHB-11173 SS5]
MLTISARRSALTLTTRRACSSFLLRTGTIDRLFQTKRDMSISMHPSLSAVSTELAPAAIGPYSQAVKVGDLVFVSGCIGFDPKTMLIVEGGVEAQAEQALKNMKNVLEASGSEVGKVAKTTVFLKDMNDFVAVNGVYAKFFGDHKPARSAVEVARLPKDALFEMECIASLK